MIDQTCGNGSIWNEEIVHKFYNTCKGLRIYNPDHLMTCVTRPLLLHSPVGNPVLLTNALNRTSTTMSKVQRHKYSTFGSFIVFSGCSGCIKTGPQFEGQSHHRWVLEVHELSCVCCYRGYNYRYDFLSDHTNIYFFYWKYTI